MDLIKGPTEIENTKHDKLIQLEKKKEQLAEDQIKDVEELKDSVKELESNIEELSKYNEEKAYKKYFL
mgnify:CR=1 FL=1